MYVTVSLKIELDANATLSAMERQIQAAGRTVMQDSHSAVSWKVK